MKTPESVFAEKILPPQLRPPVEAGAGHTFRNRMIAGIVTLIPIVVTIWVFLLLSNRILNVFGGVWKPVWGVFLDETRQRQWKWLIDIINVLPSWVLAIGVIYLVGLFSSLIAIKRLIALGESLLQRIPLIKSVYGTMKQIVDTFSMQDSRSFQRVAFVEFPRKGVWVVAFITGETRVVGDPRLYVNCFVPTTPNPTSGYLMMFPSEEVFETEMTIEQAFKFAISGGMLVMPPLTLRPYGATH